MHVAKIPGVEMQPSLQIEATCLTTASHLLQMDWHTAKLKCVACVPVVDVPYVFVL
jgi:hypothetical protein